MPLEAFAENLGDRSALCEAAEAAERPARTRASAIGKAGKASDFISVDLFGEPLDPRFGLAGRPRHRPTEATRVRVRELHQAGAKQDAIAKAIGLSVPTLRMNYHSELECSSAVARRRAALDQAKG